MARNLAVLASALALANGPSSGSSAAPALPEAFDAGWHGKKVCEVLFNDEAVRVARCTFAPGVGHERHWHPAHWGYVLHGGKMRITDESGTVTRDIQTGSNWKSAGIGWHEVLNVGDQTTVYLIVEPKARD